MYHLRSAVWQHLIKAEQIVDEIIKGPRPWFSVETADFDCDGADEVIISNPQVSVFFDADEGGSITEFDLRQKSINIVNTLSRRKEEYHAKLLQKSTGSKDGVKTIHDRQFENKALAGKVHYDWYRRACLLDHFLGRAATIDNFSKCQYEELGDFVNQPYKISAGNRHACSLLRDGHVNGKPLRVTKAIEIKKASADIKIAYSIKNTSSENIDLWFADEFNFSLTNDDTFEQLFAEKELFFERFNSRCRYKTKLFKAV